MPLGYLEAWRTTRRLTAEEGLSWSGHERNHTFLGLGDGTFSDVTHLSGADAESDGRALAVLDWDGDGRLDLLLRSRGGPRLRLFQNRTAPRAHWISLELAGDGEHVNRDAIGARVRVHTGDRSWVASVRAGEGFLSQSSKRIHLGLGANDRVQELTVLWPDGTRSGFADVEADRAYRIEYGGEDSPPRLLPEERPRPSAENSGRPIPPLEGKAPRVILAEPLPLAALLLPSYEDEGRRVRDLAGRPTLVTIWSRTCPRCMQEFIDLRRESKSLEDLRLQMVPMNIDHPIDQEASERMLVRYDQDPSLAGPAEESLTTFLLEVLFPQIFGARAHAEIVTPTSLLLDGDGDLIALYLGGVSFAQLRADVLQLESDAPEPLADRLTQGIRLVRGVRDLRPLAEAARSKGMAELAASWEGSDPPAESDESSE